MGKHDDDKDGHKPGVDPGKIGLPSPGTGGKHSDNGKGGKDGKGDGKK